MQSKISLRLEYKSFLSSPEPSSIEADALMTEVFWFCYSESKAHKVFLNSTGCATEITCGILDGEAHSNKVFLLQSASLLVISMQQRQ